MNFQIICKEIPFDVYEDELIPLFEKSGNIRLVRLMINRGYAFVIFTTPDAVEKALNQVKYSEEIFYVKLCCIVIFYLTHS